MAEIILSKYVEPELIAVWDFIAFDNLDAADRFLNAAQSTFVQLSRNAWYGQKPAVFAVGTKKSPVISHS